MDVFVRRRPFLIAAYLRVEPPQLTALFQLGPLAELGGESSQRSGQMSAHFAEFLVLSDTWLPLPGLPQDNMANAWRQNGLKPTPS